MDHDFLRSMCVLAVIIVPMILIAWIVTTWMRVRHGYPLTDGNGKSVYPKASNEVAERLALASQENAQLRAELGAVKDRLSTVERIVTDRSYSLDQEIEKLRIGAN